VCDSSSGTFVRHACIYFAVCFSWCASYTMLVLLVLLPAAGMVLRCAVYLIMYYTYSQPRAVVWQLYVVTCAIYYSCQGQAFLLSQVCFEHPFCQINGLAARILCCSSTQAEPSECNADNGTAAGVSNPSSTG
jgi:hypothetical protein